ncbi:hypothetical protein AVEN_264303-1 [Araneus ventricosus]|uniref:Uncharacterized protein n=1 Tax=Araneus ventricosus TaxID=182803 RepID=A0A4Y2E0H1_ARAVE|nr:hypothetical protein AVEN_264303-1 [Araneus ventricosus]
MDGLKRRRLAVANGRLKIDFKIQSHRKGVERVTFPPREGEALRTSSWGAGLCPVGTSCHHMAGPSPGGEPTRRGLFRIELGSQFSASSILET